MFVSSSKYNNIDFNKIEMALQSNKVILIVYLHAQVANVKKIMYITCKYIGDYV